MARLVHRDLFGQRTPIARVLNYRVIDPCGDGPPVRVADVMTQSGYATTCYVNQLEITA